MKHRKLAPVLAVVALMGATMASAQRMEHSSTTEGRGDYRSPNVSTDIREVTAVLDGNGTLQLGLIGRERVNLVGKWDRRQGDRYDIRINRGHGGDRDLTGYLDVRDGYVRNISLRNDIGRDRYDLSFNGTRALARDRGNGGDGILSDILEGIFGGRRDDDRWDDRDNRDRFDLRDAPRGTGSFRYRYDNSRLTRVTVDIRRDGRVFVEFPGERLWTLVGRYDRMRGDTLHFDIYDGLAARDVRGNGTIVFDRDRRNVRSVVMNGTADRDNFRLDFREGQFGYLDQIVTGNGDFTFRDRRDRTNRVRVMLNPNGRFTIRVEDGPRTEFQGYWREERNNEISLRIDRTLPDERGAYGDGYIRLDGRDQVVSIDLRGRSDFGRFDLNFRCR